jgi:uncharacterized membrane protein
MNSARLIWIGFTIIFVGILVVALGTFLGSSGSSSIGGFILIGPIPIVFGGGPDSGTLAIVAIAISAVMVVVYLASFFYWSAGRHWEAD